MEDQLSLPKPRFSISRWELWRVAVGMILDHPLLGVGPDNFRMTYPSVIGVSDADRSYHTHNLYLEVFVSVGIAGGLVLLWLPSRLLSPLGRLWQRTENFDLAFWVGASAAASAILGSRSGRLLSGIYSGKSDDLDHLWPDRDGA